MCQTSAGHAAASLTPLEYARLCLRIGRIVCSEPWQRDLLEAIEAGRVPRSRAIERTLRRIGYYPPGPGPADRSAVHTPMGPCMSRVCQGRLYPAYYLRVVTLAVTDARSEQGPGRPRRQMRICLDCLERWRTAMERRQRRHLGETVPIDEQARLAIESLLVRGVVLDGRPLMPDSEQALRREIRLYAQCGPVALSDEAEEERLVHGRRPRGCHGPQARSHRRR